KSIPLRLPADSNYPESFEIRGEILLPWKQFDKLNQEREAKNEPLFANPRNAAAGTLKLQNSAEVARRGLDAYFYYILSDNLPFDNHFDNMQQAKNWGFKVAPVMQILNSIDEVRDFISHWDIERKQLPIATDGLVFKINNLRQQLNLGSTAKSPRWAVAFKFQAERACTPLKFVSFEVGRTGVVTPVANLEPVLLSGTIVKRASLHNEDIIRSLDIHNGDHVYVEKGGEIIPKIVGVELSKRIPDSTPLHFVTHCPVCGTPLTRIEGEAAWICPNKYECQPQIVGKIEHFVGRRMMNIDGIGEEVADQLFSVGLVTNIADLYDLTEEKLTNLDRFQTKSAQRILKGINESRNVPFERVIFALSIPFVGETTAKVLAEATHNIDTLMSLNEEQLSSINEIGDKIAKSIVEFFKNDTNRNTIERLRNAGLQMAISEDELLNKTDKLEGKSIVISGTFALHSRDEYKKMIAQNGGKNVSSISAKTDFVFAGENMGPAKLEKAQKLGIPIINEEEFLKMIE
ncbi:MAG: NAD-dependent DNA ligase LigA, partial [Muribaculaceae bacterium]|nr:NAD-dependent DNA ligase LigA [Muribaculaceae bacterium]